MRGDFFEESKRYEDIDKEMARRCEEAENQSTSSADWDIPMAKIVQDSEANLLRKVRDKYVPGKDAYMRAFLSQLADRIEHRSKSE